MGQLSLQRAKHVHVKRLNEPSAARRQEQQQDANTAAVLQELLRNVDRAAVQHQHDPRCGRMDVHHAPECVNPAAEGFDIYGPRFVAPLSAASLLRRLRG